MSFLSDQYDETEYIRQMSEAIERTFDDDLNGSQFKKFSKEEADKDMEQYKFPMIPNKVKYGD